MLCAAAVTAQFISGKATRDALFLTSLDFTALPAMLIATSICSLVLVGINSKIARRIAPATLVPSLFVASGLLFFAEWLLRASAPSTAAIAVYLHISAFGPIAASGFWLIASERFDPRSAKKHFGQIAGAGTLGGLVSALATERVATLFGVPAMLPVLAVSQFVCAGLVRRLGAGTAAGAVADSSRADAVPHRSAIRVVAETPYLRNLAALVLFGTTSAALVDYLFKAHAVETFGRGDNLLRFFALYYAVTSLITFVLQTSSSRLVLERFGLGLTTSTPSAALLIGSVGSLVAPGFGSLMVARGGESVFRSSWFRAGYELFYTPMPASEKRAAKSLIDVAFDRLGDALGGGLVRMVILLLPAVQAPSILTLAIACSGVALYAASRLNRGYIGTLGSSLINRGGILPSPNANETSLSRTTIALVRNTFNRAVAGKDAAAQGHSDRTTRSMMRSLLVRGGLGPVDLRAPDTHATRDSSRALEPEIRDIISLRSRNRGRVIDVLGRAEGISTALVPHVVPLLAWDAVANHAMFALKKVAEEHIGELTDALIDPNQDFTVRRRLARVFSICVSERAAAGVMLGLDDLRFDVRHQSARSLLAILEKNPRIKIDRERVFEVVLREAAVGRPVWESRRLLDNAKNASPLDEFVRDRAGESLAHVFTLLSLVLEREPLQIAFRSLHTDDEYLQGTALEYLESVLPTQIRQRLWPFLERRPLTRTSRPRHEVMADLLRSNHSVLLNLEEMRRRVADTTADTAI